MREGGDGVGRGGRAVARASAPAHHAHTRERTRASCAHTRGYARPTHPHARACTRAVPPTLTYAPPPPTHPPPSRQAERLAELKAEEEAGLAEAARRSSLEAEVDEVLIGRLLWRTISYRTSRKSELSYAPGTA